MRCCLVILTLYHTHDSREWDRLTSRESGDSRVCGDGEIKSSLRVAGCGIVCARGLFMLLTYQPAFYTAR